MAKKRYKWLLIAVLLLLPLFSACSSANNPAHSAQKMDELGQSFMLDLRDTILPNKEHYDALVENRVVVSTDDGALGLDYLYEFYQNCKDGKADMVTFQFGTKAIVVARIVYDGSNIYYYRYEYSDKPIEVSARVADSITVTYDEKLKKTELTLKAQKKQLATFSFKDPVKTESAQK